MEPTTTSERPATIFSDGRAKAADEKIARLSELLHRLEEAAQNDGLAVATSTDEYQSQLVKVRLGVASSLFAADSTDAKSVAFAVPVGDWQAR